MCWSTLVDIGSGTGALAASICEQLIRWSTERERVVRLRVKLIDNGGAAPAKKFQDQDLRRSIEILQRVTADYRTWLPTQITSTERRLRAGLACKTFDMSSSLDIQTFGCNQVPNPDWCDRERRSPTACLSRDPTSLMVSPARLAVKEGHAYALASLSDYFAGLTPIHRKAMDDAVCLPVRRFDPQALVTDRGRSVLDEMLRFLDYVVIEDADLRPSDLVGHLSQFPAAKIRARDLTAAMGLIGNYAYVLWPSTNAAPPVEGVELA